MGEAQASNLTTGPDCLNLPSAAAIIFFVSTPGVASSPLIVPSEPREVLRASDSKRLVQGLWPST